MERTFWYSPIRAAALRYNTGLARSSLDPLSCHRIPPGPLLRLHSLNPFKKISPHFLEDLTATYGEIVQFRILKQRCCFVSGPKLAFEILVTKKEDFKKNESKDPWRVLFGNVLLTNEGAFHLEQRFETHKKLAADLKNLRALVDDCFHERSGWTDDQLPDFASGMHRLIFLIDLRLIFGIGSTPPLLEELYCAVKNVVCVARRPYEFGLGVGLPRLRMTLVARYERSRKHLASVVERILARGRADGKDFTSLSALLLPSVSFFSGAKPASIREEANLLFSGVWTTAHAVNSCWRLALQNPPLLKRLREESSVYLSEGLSEHTLKFTRHFLFETLRLFPPVPLIRRMTEKKVTLGSYSIPKDTLLIISAANIHGNPLHFPDPSKFDPDRWEKMPQKGAGAYLPFGLGVHSCVGERMATLTCLFLLVNLVSRKET